MEADFIFRDKSEGIVLIFQSRWRKHATNESAKDIAYFANVLDRLQDSQWLATANERVRDFAQKIQWESDKFDLRYISLGRFDASAERAVADAIEATKASPLDVTLSFLGETDLNLKFRTSIAQHQPLPGNQELHTKEAVAVGKSWLTVVTGSQIKQLYVSGKRDQLFSENVRLHLGTTKINKKIRETLETEPASFYYYNNGISCLVNSIERDSTNARLFRISGLQVINGAQTVRTIGDFAGDDKLQDVRVLMRITLRESDPTNSQFARNIIRYNNTQNAIKEQDFVSNDPVQIDLVKRFDYTRFAKKVIYHPKRGPRQSAKNYNIEVVEFSQRILAFLDDPLSYAGSIPELMSPDKKHYKVVFGNGTEVFAKMPEDEFRFRSGIWWLSEIFDEVRKMDRKVEKYGASLDSQALLLFVTSGLLRRLYPKEHRHLLVQLYRGEWKLEGDSRHEKMLKKLYELARDVLREDFAARRKDEPNFKPTEWKRNPETLVRLRAIFEDRAGLDMLAMSFPAPFAV
jgi:hypothetical protein